MKKYCPEKMELGPRDVVARAAYEEIQSGRGTEHGGVWLDITHLPKEKILDRLTFMYKQFKELNGIDISKDKMEVGPTAHYSMGGVAVDKTCKTKINGLFAVGEVISQIHGANRLGGNSLLDTQVFGKIAGKEASKFSKNITTENNLDFISNEVFVVKDPLSFRNEIQKIMMENAGIIRDEKKLQNGLKHILELKERFYSKDNIIKEFEIDDENVALAWEVRSSLIICEAIIRGALMRTESRGAHYRSDFPEQNDKLWKMNIYYRNKDPSSKNYEYKEMILFKEPVKEIEGHLKDFIKNHKKTAHHREFE